MKIFISIIALLITLTACAGPSSPGVVAPSKQAASPSPTATTKPAPIARPSNTPRPTPTATLVSTPTPLTTKLTLWESLPPAQLEQLEQDVAAFSQINPRVIIDIQHYDNPQTLAAAIEAEQIDYDLLLGPAPLLAPLQEAGKIQPMSEFFPSSFFDAFANAALAGAARNGELWGLPDTAGFHLLLFYNQDLLENPPATVEELTQFGQDFSGNSRWGLVMNSYDPLWLVPWITAFGGELTDESGNPALDSEAVVEALALFANWHNPDEGIAPLTSYTEASDMFKSGQAALLIDGEWAIAELEQNAEIPWGVIQLPAVDETVQGASPLVLSRYWAIGSQTSGRRAEAAIAFMEFITQGERQLTWTERFGLLPTRRDALNAPLILTDPARRVSARQLQNGYGLPLGADADALLNAMRFPLEQLLNGELSPAEAAALMQEQASKFVISH